MAGKYSIAKIYEIASKSGGKCWYCGCDFTDSRYASVDHVDPYHEGDLNETSNLVMACRRCNSRKNDNSTERLREQFAIEALNLPKIPKEILKYVKEHGSITWEQISAKIKETKFYGESLAQNGK